MKKSFILFIDSLEVLKKITDEQAGKFFKAIYYFHIGEDFKTDLITEVLLAPLESQFKRNNEKYEQRCVTNKANALMKTKKISIDKDKKIGKIQKEMIDLIEQNYDETYRAKYNLFLNTVYWDYVKNLKLKEQSVCEKCGSNKFLQIHHLRYNNHYNEHKHLEDLIVLCRNCHKKDHE